MTSHPDDALHWDGDEPDRPSPSAARPAPASAAPTRTPAPAAPTKASDRGDIDRTDEADEAPEGIGNVALVFYGIIGGVYLLFAAGWAVGGFRLRPRASLLLPDLMYFPWLWAAVLALPLWFVAAWVLTRGKATWIRVVALIGGAVLLVPWPFVMFGTVGA